jgi:hypothetical protein
MPNVNGVYAFVPGAVAANTPTAMPADAPLFQRVTSVVVLTEASGGTASTTSPVQAQVVYSVPSGGLTGTQFYYNPTTNQWQYGSATTTGTVFIVQGFTQGALGRTA